MDDNEKNGIAAAAAARWGARLRAPDCTTGEREEFDGWLAADPAHERAYRKVERFLALAHALPEQLSSPEKRAAQTPVSRERTRPTGRWRPSLPIAACLAGLGVLALLTGRPLPTERPAELVTNTSMAGERLVLADGSTLYLDAGSSVRVNVNERKRQLEVLAGRALFEVVHDPSRPFTVRAGDSRTVALGTVFQVEYSDARVQVTLASGSVLVSGRAWQERLEPGFELSWKDATAPPVRRAVDAARVTAWTRGRHNFHEAPLRQVVDELNRYDGRRIVIADPAIADLVVGGSFIAGDNRSVAAALESVLPVRAEDRGEDQIVLRSR